jgi:hypothetical protein
LEAEAVEVIPQQFQQGEALEEEAVAVQILLLV